MSRGRERSVLAEALRVERRARATGAWPAWERHGPPAPGRYDGWVCRVTHAFANHVFAVLVRPVVTPWGEVTHYAIRNVSGTDITWAEKQRIKDELAGGDRTAIEVFPPTADLVDEADMYHLWLLPIGFALPFGIHRAGLCEETRHESTHAAEAAP